MFRKRFLVERLWGRLTSMRGPVVAYVVVFDFPVFLIAFFSNRNRSCPSASSKGILVKVLPYHGN